MQENTQNKGNAKTFWLTIIIMFCFWIFISWDFEALGLILGVISSALVAKWSHDLLLGDVDLSRLGRGLWAVAKYSPWLLWQIFLANLAVLRLCLAPGGIDPVMTRFDPGLKTKLGKVILANSITLTPGTVTVEAWGDVFVVHALTRGMAEDVLAGGMQAKVRQIEAAIEGKS